MTYIKILESFRDTHTKEIYKKDSFLEITEERYEEIISNAKKWNKELIRLATEEEIKENFDVDIEEVANVVDDQTELTEEQLSSDDTEMDEEKIPEETEEDENCEIEATEKEIKENQEETKTKKNKNSRK